MKRSIPLFVYGTLRKGQPANVLLQEAAFRGPTRTAPLYELVRVGWYPGLVARGNTSIVGELYAVPSELLPKLAEYEGEEFALIPITLNDGRLAYSYALLPGTANGHPVIRSGDWLE